MTAHQPGAGSAPSSAGGGAHAQLMPRFTRLWRGWTAGKDADAYERFLLTHLFPSMRTIPGFRGADVLRHEEQDETAFVTPPGSTHSMPSAPSPATTTKPQSWNQPPGHCSHATTSARSTSLPHHSRSDRIITP
jgi:hypothetical protein